MNAAFVWSRVTAIRVGVASAAIVGSFFLIGAAWALLYIAVCVAWLTFSGTRMFRSSCELTPQQRKVVGDDFAEVVRLVPESSVGGAGALWTPRHKNVLVTDKVLALPSEQMRAVVNHERGHLATVPTLEDVSLVVLFCSIFVASSQSSAHPATPLVAFTALVCSYFLMRFLNRQSEVGADAWAVAHGTNPGALADALEALSGTSTRETKKAPSFVNLLATHPPISERVRRLREWSHASGP